MHCKPFNTTVCNIKIFFFFLPDVINTSVVLSDDVHAVEITVLPPAVFTPGDTSSLLFGGV